jgi:hypothetical protein
MSPFIGLALVAAVLVLAVALVAASRTVRKKVARWSVARRERKRKVIWRPVVQHHELPPPPEDPVIVWTCPPLDTFTAGRPPLSDLGISSSLRGQLDGFALGRAKRILEAPNLLGHAAADADSWPNVESAVKRTLSLAESRGAQLASESRGRLMQALALCAAHGVLLAEWRQLEDGPTIWEGDSARIRATDAFTLQRIGEVLQRRLLSDLFAGIQRRPAGFEVATMAPYCVATAFQLRLHGKPPVAFSSLVASGQG